jgi:hypothetical protein
MPSLINKKESYLGSRVNFSATKLARGPVAEIFATDILFTSRNFYANVSSLILFLYHFINQGLVGSENYIVLIT